nr:zinc ribbon domain-containing protein [Lachnospiraceae bacterium]
MFCNRCGNTIQPGMQFCNRCGAPVVIQEQKQKQWNREKPAPEPAPAPVPKEKNPSGKKSKVWLIPVIAAAVLALGAGIYFLFLRGGNLDLNNYLVPTVTGSSGNYTAKMGLDSVRLVQENGDALAVTDRNRQKVRDYLRNTYSLGMDMMVDLAVQAEKASLSIQGYNMTDDQVLAELAVVAALADRTTLGGNKSVGRNNVPEIRIGSLNRSSNLSTGDVVRFSWGAADTGKLSDLFGVKANLSDFDFTVSNGSSASVPSAQPGTQDVVQIPTTPQQQTAPIPTETLPVQTEAPTPEQTTPAPTTTTAPTTPQPTTTTEPSTEAPTAIISTTEAPTEPSVVPVSVGQIVTFGSYEQDGYYGNGAEPIEWIIFAFNEDRVWLLSRYILDMQEFNKQSASITYQNSSINRWLNSAFLNSAFTASEQSQLLELDADATLNPQHQSTKQGGTVYAKVALLSISEIQQYFPSESKRQAQGTPYAKTKLFVSDNGYSPWWTRTMGQSTNLATLVRSDGTFNYDGRDLTVDQFGVRPCISLPRSILR